MLRKTLILAAILLALGCSGGGSGSTAISVAPTAPGSPAAPAVPNSPAVPAAPAIQTAPANQTAVVGGSATFSVSCTGSDVSYIWQDGGGATLGTSASYTTPATALADDGKVFTITVSNAGGSAHAQAFLHVVQKGIAPTILLQPEAGTFRQGDWSQFAIMVEGAPTPAVQWFVNGTPVDGATGTLCAFALPDLSLDGAVVHAVVSNASGRVTSRDAILHVDAAAAPFYEIQPRSVTSYPGAMVTFASSTAAASSVVWIVDGVSLAPGQTQADLGGSSTIFSVTPDPQGFSSCMSFNAPATAGSHTVQSISTASGISVASDTVTLNVVAQSGQEPSLSIRTMLIDQGIQLPDGSVPLVANRAGLLRVACEASAYNVLTPSVGVTVTVPGQAPATFSVPSSAAGVPTAADVTAYPSQTWDIMLPASLIQANAKIAVTLDPGGQNITAPVWTIHAAKVLDLNIKFIPIVLAGGTPSIGASDVQAMVEGMTRIFPLAKIVATVGAPFTPSVSDISTVANVNRALADLEAKRIANGDLHTYYQGVWASGVPCVYAGLANIGSPTGTDNRTSMVVLGAPVSSAHELGHTLGLQHAPGGSANDPDPNYPYTDALIGPGQPVDITGPGLLPVDPQEQMYHDIMGYAGQFWISDYNYTKVLKALSSPDAQ